MTFSDKLKVGLVVPAWTLLTTVGTAAIGGAYYGGAMVTKMDQLIELTRETKHIQTTQQAQIDRINERQIGGLAGIANHDAQIRSLDNRVTDLERRK